jgi:hypothetical protein
MNDFLISECIFHGHYPEHLAECPVCDRLTDQIADTVLVTAARAIALIEAPASAYPPSTSASISPKQRGNKVAMGGYTFDSTGEYKRFLYLCTLQHKSIGLISELVVHPKWELLPSLRLNHHFEKRSQTAITYEADFSYVYEGVFVAEDFKAKYGNSAKNRAKGIAGKPIVTDASRLRHKLLIAKLPAIYGDSFVFRIVTEAEERVGL